jgi:hypothetical protein
MNQEKIHHKERRKYQCLAKFEQLSRHNRKSSKGANGQWTKITGVEGEERTKAIDMIIRKIPTKNNSQRRDF